MIILVGSLLVVLCLVGAWMLAGYLPTRKVATPGYTIIERRPDYEVRRYDAYVVAETVQRGSHAAALNAGFGELFRYIAGDNLRTEKVPMTAPVLQSNAGAGQKIPMTAPVLNHAAGDQHIVAFVMPPGATVADLPAPRSANVVLRAVPPHRAAVVRFSGNATAAVMQAKTAALLAALARDGKRVLGPPREAFYNPPWTPPFMRRNEVLVAIE